MSVPSAGPVPPAGPLVSFSPNPMSPRVRNRVVVFRLSQEEYRSLKEACESRGARNLSDFTRSELLASLQSGSLAEHLTRRFAMIEAQIVTMQSAIAHLNQSLQGVIHAVPVSQR